LWKFRDNFRRDRLNTVTVTVNQIAGRLVSGVAGYAVASSVGATIVGGAIAGGVTGIVLAIIVDEASPHV